MASFWYEKGLAYCLSGQISLGDPGLAGDSPDAASDLRVIWCMSNSTADTERDSQFVADIGTLDEYDGTGYSRQALASEAMTVDTTAHEVRFDAADVTLTGVGAGSRDCHFLVVYKHVTNDADSPVLCCIDLTVPGEEFTGTGGDVTINWDSQGIAKISC